MKNFEKQFLKEIFGKNYKKRKKFITRKKITFSEMLNHFLVALYTYFHRYKFHELEIKSEKEDRN